MSTAAPKPSDVPRFERIVTREDESFLWRRDDYPWERNVWNYHPEVEIHLINNASGIAFVGDYIGEFGPGHLTIVGGGLPHDWVTTLNPGQRIEGVTLSCSSMPTGSCAFVIRFPSSPSSMVSCSASSAALRSPAPRHATARLCSGGSAT
ncbi:hypothetical protein [Devosia sp.]|uniref:hypothetical protein n=1 Tax=Devosia sp. TaxID=1871048 RepID=UPI0019F8CF4F|nr:hypothetical protein [Devosia sp.]MBE0579539.1 hypothetical protein [Devosia sp.]